MHSGPDSAVAGRHDRAAPRVRVGVISASDVQRKATIAVLQREGFEISFAAATAARVDAPRTDVVVLACEELGAVELAEIRSVREQAPETGIVVRSPDVARRALRDGLDAGLDGYVRDGDEASLALAVRSTHAGQLSLPRTLRENLGRPRLSPREKQILGMVVMGFTNAEIAQKLFVAETTVKSHLSSAFARLGVRSRGEAAALILDPETGLGTGILAISDADRASRRGVRPAAQPQ